MSLTPSFHRFTCLALMAAFAVSGCSNYDSSFVYSESTSSLMPEAQDGFPGNGKEAAVQGVKEILDARFGTPQNIKAWLALPIDFGGTTASVSLVESDSEVFTVTLAAEEGLSFPEAAMTLHFTSGAASGETISVSDWDPETGVATLSSAPSRPLAEGDTCSIDGGSVMKSGRVLYMRHCSHCHGTSGDGHGPTAEYLNPRPRDYRHGVFKFKSTNDMSKVSRKDLERILRYGIPGTYMPSFLLLDDDELHAIVEYVRFLSMRGEYERRLGAEVSVNYSNKALQDRLGAKETRAGIVAELKEFLSSDLSETASTLGEELGTDWADGDSEEALIVPSVPRIPDTAESRRKGRDLFLSKTLNCADCHGIDGAGNGPQTMAYEKKENSEERFTEPGLHDAWGNLNQPRNLHTGIYRGGRRPIDLFCRIHGGIKGSKMPSFKNTPHEDIWHVVNYVLSIPFGSEPGATGDPVVSAEVVTPE